jgi:hypothetical protein
MVSSKPTREVETSEVGHRSAEGKQVVRARGVLVLFLLFFLAGCRGSSGPAVEIVVPKGFTGSVWIMLDPDAAEIPLVKGHYQVVIPAGGVLRVRSLQPFGQWHQSSARYDDGSPLPEDYKLNAGGPDTVALRGEKSVVTQRNGKDVRWMSYFVGTAKQYSKRAAMEMPPGVGE